jgi:glucose-1-phosphate thymidylyltransferase
MEIAKALILAARERDDQPWPTAPVGPKHLFPLANRPILFHNLEDLRRAGVLEAAILADDAALPALERAVGDGRQWGLRVTFAEWSPSLGLGGALKAGRDFVGDEPVMVQEGDALLHEPLQPHIRDFASEQLDTLALRLSAPGGSVELAPAPGYLLSPLAVEIVRGATSEATGPVAGVRARGGRVRVQRVDGCLPCHGDQAALLEGNRRMLAGISESYDSASLEDCTIQGPVVVHPTAQVRNSLLRGPAIIGPGARISDSYVGPHSSIGAGVVMDGVEIEYSIVLARAELRFIGARLESSVIGAGARVVRGFEMPSTLRMSLGEGAEVVLR